MSLDVLKDQSYRQYQELLSRRAEEESQSQDAAINRRRARSRFRRRVVTGLWLAGVSAAAFVFFLLLYTQLGLPRLLAAARPKASRPAASAAYVPASLQYDAGADNDPLWKCGRTTYTNAPDPSGSCEFVGTAVQSEGTKVRFITPARPSGL